MIYPINIHKTKYFNSTISIVLIAFNLFRADAIIASDRNVVDRLKADVTYLCSPELAGRNVPGKTGDITALWIAKRFRNINLRPVIEDTSYLQEVTLVQAKLNTRWSKEYQKQCRLTFTGGLFDSTDNRWGASYTWDDGFYIFPKRIAPIDTTFEITWCNYGIVDEATQRNDFADAEDKAAMVLPGSDLPNGKHDRRSLIPFKAAAAKRAGVGMLIVYDENQEYVTTATDRQDRNISPQLLKDKVNTYRGFLIDLPGSKPDFPVVYFSDPMSFCQFWPPETMEKFVKKHKGVESKNKLTVELRVHYRDYKETPGFNVVGKLEGRIPEYVIVGAHYDHLGIVTESQQSESGVASTDRMSYYPGADDNASGVAGLLEICRRWAERDRTGRGLIAVAFTAEEDGTLGSQWFVDNLPVAHETVTAMVNLDMIGRRGFANMRDVQRGDAEPDPKYAGAYFSAASPKLRDVLRAVSNYVDLNVDMHPVNSFSHFGDAGPFHEAQVPTVHLFSGFHNDYHTPNDTIDKLDFEKMSLMVDLADVLLANLSQESDRIDFDPNIKVDKPHIPH